MRGRGCAARYKLRRELSTLSTVVFEEEAAKLLIVACRGQWSRERGDPNGAGDPDDTSLQMMEPTITGHPRFAETRRIVLQLLAQFPAHRIALTGHSLGGAVAVALSEELGLPAVVFNPAAPVGIKKRVLLGAVTRGLFSRPLLGFFGLGSKLINKLGEGTWLGLAGSSSRKVGAFSK